VVALLWVVGCSNYLTRFMLVTMHGSIIAAIPMTETQFGLVFSVFLWVYAAANPVGGFLADRFGRSRVILVSMLAWSAVTVLTAYATSFPQLLVLRAIMGVSQACYLPSACALIADYHRGSTRSFATGLHMTGVTLGAAASGVGGWLAERHTWSYAFSLIGLASVIYGVLLVFVLRDPPREAVVEARSADTAPKVRFFPAVVSLLGTLSFDIALVYWGVIGAVSWVISAWMPTYIHEHFHMAQGAAGFSAGGFFFIVGLPGLLIGGAWADRWSRTNPRARIFVPAIGLCAAVPSFLLASHTGIYAFTVVNLICWGFGSSFASANMMPILCMIADPRYRATGYGVLNAASAAIGGLAIYGGGALRDMKVDLGPYLTLAGASVAVCAVLILLVRPARVEPVPAA
jgi:MFS family permease